MPKQVKPAKHPDATYPLHIDIPGWLKNRLITQAAASGVSYRAYLLTCLYRIVTEDSGVPTPPPARAPLPTIADQIRAWAVGETLLSPCGREGPCAGTTDEPVRLAEMTFCAECDIRLDETL